MTQVKKKKSSIPAVSLKAETLADKIRKLLPGKSPVTNVTEPSPIPEVKTREAPRARTPKPVVKADEMAGYRNRLVRRGPRLREV